MMRPYRLRVECTRYPHWGQHSGIAQFTRHLDERRFAVDLHAASDSDAEMPLPHDGMRRWLRGRVQRRGMPWYKLSDLSAELKALAVCAAGRADIVHFLDGEHSGQYLPEWLDRVPRRRAKLVASYHQPAELLPELVNRAIVARFDRVVLVSPAQRSYFERFMPVERIVTILHGIDVDFFRPVATQADGVFRCVTAGHWLRDWPTIRSVAQRLQSRTDIEFHIVTNRETGLEALSNVRFHREIGDEALRTLYQSASALFLPLDDSTANNTLLEAIACGLPVLSTDLPSVRAYVGDDAAILLQPGDVEGFLGAIDRLRRDPTLRARLGSGARARAEALSWQRIARDYEALYEELVRE